MVTATPTCPQNRAELFQLLGQSRLLSPIECRRFELLLPEQLNTAEETARELIAREVITRFQADRLLAGKSDGLALGPCVILRPVATTVLGTEFCAQHRIMNRLVSIFLIDPDLTRDAETRSEILSAIRATGCLAHPNILTLLDLQELQERIYLIRDYLDGADLAAIVRLGGPLTLGRACEFIRQSALGLQAAHDANVIHGQLTAESILVGRPGGKGPSDRPVVKVSGFGYRRVLRYVSHPDAHPASPIVDDPAEDVAALGAIFCHLLSGYEKSRSLPASTPPGILKLIDAMLTPRSESRPNFERVAEAIMPYVDSDDPISRIDFNLTASGSMTWSNLGLSGLTPVVENRDSIAPVNESAPGDTFIWSDLHTNVTLENTADVAGIISQVALQIEVERRVPWTLIGITILLFVLLLVGILLS